MHVVRYESDVVSQKYINQSNDLLYGSSSWKFCISCTEFLKAVRVYQGAEFDQLEEEDLDALFEEYGEVVKTDGEARPVTSEVDDDSDSLACK